MGKQRKKKHQKQTATGPNAGPGVRWERIDLRDPRILPLEDADYDTAKLLLGERMRINLEATGHPLHHLTADGTIVEPDPTIEMLMTHVSPDEMPPIPAARPGAPPAVPVVRDWYEHDPGRAWLQGYLAAQREGPR